MTPVRLSENWPTSEPKKTGLLDLIIFMATDFIVSLVVLTYATPLPSVTKQLVSVKRIGDTILEAVNGIEGIRLIPWIVD